MAYRYFQLDEAQLSSVPSVPHSNVGSPFG